MRLRCLLFILVATTAPIGATDGTPTTSSTDWPQWRGTTHDGVAAGEVLVDGFGEDGPPVLWVRELGQGYSGFAAAGGRVYTQTQSLYEQSVVCLDGDTGRTLWAHRYGWPYDGGGLYPGPRSTPAVARGKVYFAAPSGLVGCLTADNGMLLWSVNVTEKFHGRGTEFGYSASPLVVDGLVILPVGGQSASVVALDAADGSTVWKAGSKPASYATPLPIEWQGQPLVIVLLQNSLACIHRRTGELWWELPMSHGYDEHAAAPLYREPLLVVSGPFRSGAQAFRLEASKPASGEHMLPKAAERCTAAPLWLCDQLSNDVASSVLVADTIYGFDLKDMQSRLHRPSRGEFRAVDFLTGKVRWSSPEPGHAQIIAADGKLVLFNDRGEVILARASPEKYEELGRAVVFPDEICWTPPALADGRLYLRTQTRAACVYLGRRSLEPATVAMSAGDLPGRQRFNPGVLLGGEREYPATVPELGQFARWYAWCLGLLCATAALVWGTAAATKLPRHWSHLLFWFAVLLAGAAGSAVLHRLQDDYVFTWPLALWAGFQLAVSFSWSSRGTPLVSWPRARSYAAGLAFLALCALYFHLCRWLGLAIEWSFLAGFAGALPAAILAAWLASRPSRDWLPGLAYLASFSLYYWTCIGFIAWRLAA